MALKVWLPLNGDLYNQGCSNVTIISNAIVDNTGKIGSCYSFNGTNQYMYTDYNFYNTEYSICAWIYSTSASSTQCIVCDRTTVGYGFSIFLIGGKIRIDPGCDIQWTTDYTYPINTWFQLTITYDGIKVNYYINGEFKQSYNCSLDNSYWGNITSIGASQTNGENYGNYLNGKLNDIRIYNRCLSAAEVHEISQGLVLHYKLDDITNGVKDSSGYGYNGIINGDLSLSSDTVRYAASAIFNGTDARIQVPNLTLSELTISFWMKREENTNTRQFMYTAWEGITCELQTNGTPTFAVNKENYPTIEGDIITTDSGWVHYCGTFSTTNGLKLYQNGVLKSSNANVTPISYNITTSYIGYYNTYYNGKMSDFRIYCTALSADDILQLYHTSAKVDNKQNLHTFELVENNSKIQINKRGQTLCNELEEDAATKFYKTDQIIETNEIIEL